MYNFLKICSSLSNSVHTGRFDTNCAQGLCSTMIPQVTGLLNVQSHYILASSPMLGSGLFDSDEGPDLNCTPSVHCPYIKCGIPCRGLGSLFYLFVFKLDPNLA